MCIRDSHRGLHPIRVPLHACSPLSRGSIGAYTCGMRVGLPCPMPYAGMLLLARAGRSWKDGQWVAFRWRSPLCALCLPSSAS
eukprot:2023333-Alexandrium_andersonii.AAC.1